MHLTSTARIVLQENYTRDLIIPIYIIIIMIINTDLSRKYLLKDARSVSLYRFNRS